MSIFNFVRESVQKHLGAKNRCNASHLLFQRKCCALDFIHNFVRFPKLFDFRKFGGCRDVKKLDGRLSRRSVVMGMKSMVCRLNSKKAVVYSNKNKRHDCTKNGLVKRRMCQKKSTKLAEDQDHDDNDLAIVKL